MQTHLKQREKFQIFLDITRKDLFSAGEISMFCQLSFCFLTWKCCHMGSSGYEKLF